MKTISDIEIAIKPEEEHLDISSSFRTCVENLINSFQELYLLYPEDQNLNRLFDEITKLVRPIISQFINPKYTENPVQQQLRHFSKLFPICIFYETQSQNPNSGETKTIEALLNELKDELERRFDQFKQGEFALDKVFNDFPEKIDIIRKRITAVESAIKTAKPSRGNKINNDFIEYQILPLITDSNDDADTPQYYGRKTYETLQDPNADKICEAVEKVNKFLIFVNPLSYINMIDVLVKKAQSKVTPEQVENYKAKLVSVQSVPGPIIPKKSPEDELREEIKELRKGIQSAIEIMQTDYPEIQTEDIFEAVKQYKEKKDSEIQGLEDDIQSAIALIQTDYPEINSEDIANAVTQSKDEKDSEIQGHEGDIQSTIQPDFSEQDKQQLKDVVEKYQNQKKTEIQELKKDIDLSISLLKEDIDILENLQKITLSDSIRRSKQLLKTKMTDTDFKTILDGLLKTLEIFDSEIQHLEKIIKDSQVSYDKQHYFANQLLIYLSKIKVNLNVVNQKGPAVFAGSNPQKKKATTNQYRRLNKSRT